MWSDSATAPSPSSGGARGLAVIPIVTFVSLPSMSTSGGETIRLSGTDMGTLSDSVSATCKNSLGMTFGPVSCSVIASGVSVQCGTPAGVGGGVSWAVAYNGSASNSFSAPLNSYASPSLTSIVRGCGGWVYVWVVGGVCVGGGWWVVGECFYGWMCMHVLAVCVTGVACGFSCCGRCAHLALPPSSPHPPSTPHGAVPDILFHSGRRHRDCVWRKPGQQSVRWPVALGGDVRSLLHGNVLAGQRHLHVV
jgi:hypothetical protein